MQRKSSGIDYKPVEQPTLWQSVKSEEGQHWYDYASFGFSGWSRGVGKWWGQPNDLITPVATGPEPDTGKQLAAYKELLEA